MRYLDDSTVILGSKQGEMLLFDLRVNNFNTKY